MTRWRHSVGNQTQGRGVLGIGIVNTVGSSIARACDGGIYLHAGPEITVVATKTFVSTLLALMTTALQQETAVKAIAEQYSQVAASTNVASS